MELEENKKTFTRILFAKVERCLRKDTAGSIAKDSFGSKASLQL